MSCPEKNCQTHGMHATTSTPVSVTDGPTSHPPMVAKGVPLPKSGRKG